MLEINWPLFIAASLVIILSPGQDMVLVMSRGISQGARAGLITASGVSAGLLGHTILAAMGLGAVIAASEMAFTVLKYAGAVYLLWLGVRLLMSGEQRFDTLRTRQSSLPRLFTEGAISNLSNPKIVLFYFAFLPQFIPLNAKSPAVLLIAMGVAYAALAFLVKVPMGLFAGTLSEWFRSHPGALTWMFRSSGMVLVGFGLRLAFEERR